MVFNFKIYETSFLFQGKNQDFADWRNNIMFKIFQYLEKHKNTINETSIFNKSKERNLIFVLGKKQKKKNFFVKTKRFYQSL